MVSTPHKKAHINKPASLSLKGSKLEDFLPLLPAEENLRQSAANGEDCVVEDYQDKRPEQASSLNTIRAEFLRYMILGGCEKSPVHARGINLYGAHIECEKIDKHDESLNLESAKIDFIIQFYNCKINGNLILIDAKTKTLYFSGTQLKNLNADSLHAEGRFAFKNDSIATMKIKLRGAYISNDLDLKRAILKDGIDAESIKVARHITLDQCSSEGTIEIKDAVIDGNLECDKAELLNANNSLIANRAKIDGDVDLENVIAKGTIALTGTQIGGDFTPQGAKLEGVPALQLRNSKIGGTLVWRTLGFVNGEVDFSGASCTTINTDGDTWMRKRKAYHEKRCKDEDAAEDAEIKKPDYNTKLDNFTYQGFSNLPDNCKAEFWIEFLNQQPEDHLAKNFKPRPWEQLASVLDTMGYQEEALELRIEKQKLQTNFMATHEPAAKGSLNLWHWGQVFFRKTLWGPLVGYGYKPGNALIVLFGIIMLGTIIYNQAAKRGVMTPTHPLIYKEAREGGYIPAWCAENWVYFPDENCASAMPSEYSEFQSFIYAADIALPVVNLRMEADWSPRVVFTDGSPDSFGWWVRLYEWFLIAAGWILSLLFVSAVGSSIRK